jgi:C-terminal peptidase prc
MEAEQAKDFDQDIRGEYPGIGAHISKRSQGPLEVLRPIYGGPAHKAGLLSGDLIIEIDGRTTPTLRLDELKDLLRGPRGTSVMLKILRRGWNEPRDFLLSRDKIELSSVFYESLPEGLGYLRLTQFGARSATEFREALDKLEAKGLDGLIIDFRNNPGGYLPVAEKIADLFVAGDLPIVTQKGRDGQGEETTMPDPEARSGYSIVILVNENSASASEVVSGCLQDHRRATLVGQRTFGKGSVQRLIPIESAPGSTLKLTVQYWYLPLGRCINTMRDEKGRVIEKGGVLPDIEVERVLLPTWRLEERATLRTNEKIADYVEKHLPKLRELVPLGDHDDESRYPSLAELHTALDTHALRADVRQVLRYHVRRKLEDERGREFAFDLQEDHQMQRAIVHLLDVIGRDAAKSKAWSWLETHEEKESPETGAGSAKSETEESEPEESETEESKPQ